MQVLLPDFASEQKMDAQASYDSLVSSIPDWVLESRIQPASASTATDEHGRISSPIIDHSDVSQVFRRRPVIGMAQTANASRVTGENDQFIDSPPVIRRKPVTVLHSTSGLEFSDQPSPEIVQTVAEVVRSEQPPPKIGRNRAARVAKVGQPPDQPIVRKCAARVENGAQSSKNRRPTKNGSTDPNAGRSLRQSKLKNPMFQLQAREDRGGKSVSGTSNSSDDEDATDLSCVSQNTDHPNADRADYLAGLQSQNDMFGTPLHLRRFRDEGRTTVAGMAQPT